ncbi:MAG: peptidoglycan-binding protein [Methyloceanibacter sp.]
MDQRSVESLLLRLVERVTESERRYGEALEDLHGRLDQLSETAAPPDTDRPSPEDAATLERLRNQIGKLAQRLDRNADPLEDFARLDRTLSEGMREARYASKSDYDFPEVEPVYTAPPPLRDSLERDVDRRLMETVRRLERSVGTAMPAAAIEALSARLDDIVQQLTLILTRTPTRENLQHVQRQLSGMGHQLGRAERQLAKIGDIEGQLLKLIARVDEKPAMPDRPPVDLAQLKDIAHKAAVEAAGRVIKEEKLSTIERLDAMQRDLTAVSDRNRQSNDQLATKLQAVHESLKQLAQKVEQNPPAKSRSAFVERSSTPSEPILTSAPQSLQREARPSAEMRQERETSGAAGATLKDRHQDEPSEARRDEKKAFSFGRAKRHRTDEEIPQPQADKTPDTALKTPEELVEAARRGLRAASLRGEQGASGLRSRLASEAETRLGRKRSLLIIAAAVLLALSAALLYERLRTKPKPEMAPPAVEQTVPAPAKAKPEAPRAHGRSQPQGQSDTAILELEHPDAWKPLPPTEERPADSAGRRTSDARGVTDLAKSTHLVSAEAELSPEMQSPWLSTAGPVALPPGVVFTLDGSRQGGQTKAAPQTIPTRFPLPPAELGPLALRQAAAEGDAKAQYLIALRYAQGKGTSRDLAEARRWLERAASAGLAPAQYRLGTMYERGEGIAKDLGRARSWYAAAAEKGNVKAMHNLAIGDNSGDTDQTDYETAAKWHEAAAAYGFTDSQFNLGILYERGLGRPQNLVEAYKWFALAGLNGDAEAARQRDRVEVFLNSEELTKAVQAVKAWQPKAMNVDANQVREDAAWNVAEPNPALVTRAQALLNQLGYDAGPPDGVFGSRTRSAIQSFERRNGLEETGEVSIPLVTTLERLIG